MQMIRYDTIDSTSCEARRLLEHSAVADTLCLLAREQTAGRGTRGRTWHSPCDAGIYLSYVKRATGDPFPVTTHYTLAAAVACAEVLLVHAGVSACIKPVNDLLVQGRKLGGILTETVVRSRGVEALIIGVGLNVRHVTLPNGPVAPISIEEVIGPEAFGSFDPQSLAATLAEHIDAAVCRVVRGDTAQLCETYRRLLCSEYTSEP